MEIVTLGLVLAIGLCQLIVWSVNRLWIRTLFGAVFLIAYPADLVYIYVTQQLYFSPTLNAAFDGDAPLGAATLMVVITWLVFSICVSLASRARSAKGPPTTRRLRLLAYALVGVVLATPILQRVQQVGLESTLLQRQAVFGDNLVLLIAYYVLPVLVPFGIAGALQANLASRWAIGGIALAALLASFATGSRSGLFLSCILPSALLVWRQIGLRQGVLKDAGRLLLLMGTSVLVFLGGAWYLSEFRGVAAQETFFGSSDISQADVLLGLIQTDGPLRWGSSYLAGLTTLVPRSVWEGKPLPGNVEASLTLTPERYSLTGAETTAGLLGEGFINFGIFGAVTAAVILAAMCIVAERLTASPDTAVWVLGVVVALRAINLVRGDLANVAAPTVFALVVWMVVFARQRVTPGSRGIDAPTAWEAVRGAAPKAAGGNG